MDISVQVWYLYSTLFKVVQSESSLISLRSSLDYTGYRVPVVVVNNYSTGPSVKLKLNFLYLYLFHLNLLSAIWKNLSLNFGIALLFHLNLRKAKPAN